MFDRATLPPDTLMFEHIDAIKQYTNRVRLAPKDHVDMDPLDDISMIRGQAEYFSRLTFAERWHFSTAENMRWMLDMAWSL
jgi:hypothetical protein